MRTIFLTGRILFSLLFIIAGISDFTDTFINYTATIGVPLPYVFIPLSGMMAVIGAASILFGYKAKSGAWLILLFALPVSVYTQQFGMLLGELNIHLQQGTHLSNIIITSGTVAIAFMGQGKTENQKVPKTSPISRAASICTNLISGSVDEQKRCEECYC